MEPSPFSKNRINLYYRIKLNPAFQITQILTKVCLLVLVVFTIISAYVLLSPEVKLSHNPNHPIKDHTRQYVKTATINRPEQSGITKDSKKESEKNEQTTETLKNIENEREKENMRNEDGKEKDVMKNKNNLQHKEDNDYVEETRNHELIRKDNEDEPRIENENRIKTLKTTKNTQNKQIRVIKGKHKDVQQKDSLKVSEIRKQNNHPVTKLEAATQQKQNDNSAMETDELITIAKRLSKNNTKTVLIAAINDGYTRLVYNWLCNTKDMGVHNQVLFVVFDEKFTKRLQKDWPEVTSIYYKGIDDKGNVAYGTAGYARIVLYRVQIIMNLLQNDVKILLFETDFVWFRNPLPFLENITDYDLAVTKVSVKDKHEMYCIGFVFMYPTVATKSLWKNLSIEMQEVYEKVKSWDTKKSTKYEHGIEQNRFSHLLYYKYADINYKVLPELKFPDGQWYLTMATKPKNYDPILIHNNFVIGNGIKEFKAKMFGHWFIKDDLTCNNKKAELGLHKTKKP